MNTNIEFYLTRLLSKSKNTLFYGGILLSVCVSTEAFAQLRHAPKPIYIAGHHEAVVISVSQHELALTQVLYEICPPMLDKKKQEEFYKAYHEMLHTFIPKAQNPSEILRRLSSQQEYRKLLQQTRAWTTTNYSPKENQEVCERFAQESKYF